MPDSEKVHAYFMISDGRPQNDFVIALSNPALIDQARKIIAGKIKGVHVKGILVKQAAWYNSKWAFHLEPDSITFPEISIEVCDAETSYVEENLKEACGSFLPDCVWCPWSQRVVQELHLSDQDDR
jgi:hypothetical protein